MAISHSLGDFLTKIRNASMAKHENVDVKSSKVHKSVISIFQEEGYIKDFKEVMKDKVPLITVTLNYDEKRNPVIHGINSISTPGRKVYSSYKNMPRVLNGYGTLVVSSSKGVMTGKKAKMEKVGGELICSIW